jgi:hypothetical protein
MKKGKDKREVLRTGGKLAAVFVVALLSLGVLTFFLVRVLGLEV